MNEVEEIKDKLDIVDYVGRVVQLKKTGQNYKGLCPFHNEKTPSFIVSPDKQIFHCFGCNEGGDIFAWVMKIDGFEFVEALKKLASDAGVTLSKNYNPEKSDRREKLFSINEEACLFFEENLKNDIGKKAFDYLRERKLTNKTICEFRLGYASAGNTLIEKLKSQGYKEEELVAAGVAKVRDGKIFSQFRDRVTFPIVNAGGRVVGFSARVLDSSSASSGQTYAPKYINTPSTDIYDKSSILYGIYQAREAIRKQNHAIIVEGNMDVIASYQAGVKNVVASSGTALTERQLDILKKFSSNIKLAFDVDMAGDMATKRAINLAYMRDMNIKVIEIPGDKDAADAVAKDPQIWLKAVKEAKHVMDYMMEKLFTAETKKDVLSKKKATKEFISYINKINDFVEKDHYIKKLADKIDVKEDQIRNVLDKKSLPERKNEQSKEKKGKDIRGAVELKLIALVLNNSQQLKYVLKELSEDDFLNIAAKDLYKKVRIYYNKEKSFELKKFNKFLGAAESRDLNVSLIKAEQEPEYLNKDALQEEIFYLVKKVKKLNIQAEKAALTKELKKAEAGKDEDWQKKILKKIQELIKKEQKV